MSKSLDPDQDRHFVGPDLGPNCLQRLSADDTNRQKVKLTHLFHVFHLYLHDFCHCSYICVYPKAALL